MIPIISLSILFYFFVELSGSQLTEIPFAFFPLWHPRFDSCRGTKLLGENFRLDFGTLLNIWLSNQQSVLDIL